MLSSPQKRSFLPEDPVSPLGTNSRRECSLAGLIGRMEGDAHLGDAHLVPEPRAYKPERLLLGV